MFGIQIMQQYLGLKQAFYQRKADICCALASSFVHLYSEKYMIYQSISPTELAERLKNKENFRFIDVREPHEYEISRIEAAELMPLTQFNEWIGTLEPQKEIVVMCHHGIRSANVCMFLVRNGFEKVWNLDGGIDAWTAEVDPRVPRY